MSAGPNPVCMAVRRVTFGTLLIFVMMASGSYAFALDPTLDVNQYAHTSWKIRDGFSKAAIASIAQTSDGYLWLGTEFGLLRFDGVITFRGRHPVVSNSQAATFEACSPRGMDAFGSAP